MLSLYPVLTIFFAPVTTFRSLAGGSRHDWVPPFLVCGLASILIAWGLAPAVRALVVNVLPSGTGQADFGVMLDRIRQEQRIGLVTAPLSLLVRWLIQTGCLWLLIHLVTAPVQFSALLMVVGYAFTVVSLGDILTTLTIHWHGVRHVQNPSVLLGAFGLDRLIAGTHGPGLDSLLRGINLFSLWQLALLMIGLSVACGLSRKTAAAVSVVTWLVPLSLTVWPLVLPFPFGFPDGISLFFSIYPAIHTADLDAMMVVQNLSR